MSFLQRKYILLLQPSLWAPLIFCGFLLLLYPLKMPFPISHEAPQYIEDSTEVTQAFTHSLRAGIHTLFTNSWYPVTTLLTTVTHTLIPIPWPFFIIGISILMHLVIAATLGSIALKIDGIMAATFTMIFWTTTFTIMHPLMNGWLAHWWSLIPLTMVLKEVVAKKYIRAFIWWIITALMHPLSMLVLLVTGFITFPSVTEKNFKHKRMAAILVTLSALAISIILISNKTYILSSLHTTKPLYSLKHLYASPIAPALLLVPIGVLAYIRKLSLKPQTIILLTFFFVSTLLTFNHLWLGGSLLEFRFEPYFLINVCLFGGIGISQIISNISETKKSKLLLTLICIGFISLGFCHFSMRFFDQFNGNNLLLPTTQELDAIKWLQMLPNDTVIVTTRHDLNYKWIPIITGFHWKGINENEQEYQDLIIGNDKQQRDVIKENHFTHFLIFKYREENYDSLIRSFKKYHTVYENEAVIIKYLPESHE